MNKGICSFTIIMAVFLIIASFLNTHVSSQQNNKGPDGFKTKKVGGIDFVLIPAGTFMMGLPADMGKSDDAEYRQHIDEHPQHVVTVSGFWIGKYEVTQKQYFNITGSNPSIWRNNNYPVDNVSWNDAKNFCQKFSAKYKGNFRLPTEAEWEYACRAGTTTVYSWGNEMNGAYCWAGFNSGEVPHPVGKKLPNNWGLHDMSGNVWEWCEDWYDKDYYSISPENDPKGPESGKSRVIRGGNWSSYGSEIGTLWPANRRGFIPDSKGGDRGFRLASPEN